MELTFEKDDLLYALQLLQGVTGGWNTLPILAKLSRSAMMPTFPSLCRCVWKALRNKRCDSYSIHAVDAENKPLFPGEVFLLRNLASFW